MILNLSIHGSLVFLVVWILDAALAGKMKTRGRGWWWTLVPIAFLLWIPLPIPSIPAGIPILERMSAPITRAGIMTPGAVQAIRVEDSFFWFWIWISGAVTYLLAVFVQTKGAVNRWSLERLSTDPGLLDLLEDCKLEAGVTAPIGLVVSERVSAPAILGWLRPRILVPKELILSRDELRAVVLHELAHFRSMDIPRNWLFTVARAIHWFNPFAHLAFYAWARFREEAADETAIGWMKDSSGAAYGEALLHAIKQASGTAAPYGALAIGESIHNLKRRITMINQTQNKSPRLALAATILCVVAAVFMIQPIRADDAANPDSTAAVAAMKAWLQEIDENQFAQSWNDASSTFQKAITSDGWVAACQSVRGPLGKCTGRTLASALHQTEVPSPTGVQKGDFVVAQFNSTFENLAYAVETVCFEKAPDGSWKASGYYVKPKS